MLLYRVMSESGLTFTHAQTANPEIYKELWKRSPIRYVDQVICVSMGFNEYGQLSICIHMNE